MAKKLQKRINKKKGIVKKGIKAGLVAMFLVLGLSTMAMAQDVISLNQLNVGGDTLYLTDTGTFAVGIGTDVVTFYDLATVRGHYVAPVEDGDYHRAGLGVGVNVKILAEKLGGTWLLDTLNPTVGITGLTNLDGKVNPELGFYSNIINVKF